MRGPALTLASRLICPHGGQVVVKTGNDRVTALGAPMLTADDRFTVVRCPFTLPGPVPSPCVRVEWIPSEKNVRVKAAAGPLLGAGSVGVCRAASGAPQGKVAVLAVQGRATAR